MSLISSLRESISQRPPASGLFLCHAPCEHVMAHFARLRRESAGQVNWHFVPDNGHLDDAAADDAGTHPSLVMPLRFAAARVAAASSGGQLMGGIGMMDIAIMPRVLAAADEFVWVVEFDVDYTGHWSRLFRRFAGNRADVLTTTLRPRAQSRDWALWATAQAPPEVAAAHWFRSFGPILRLSRRFAAAYVAAMNNAAWGGHYEFTIPTIARHLGLRVEDMAQAGPLRRLLRPAVYTNTPSHETLSPGSFVWRPAKTAYFHQRPNDFLLKDRLYHPVKPKAEDGPPACDAVEIIVPVCNAGHWIDIMLDSYTALGLRPLFILDTHSEDNTLNRLLAKNARVMAARGPHARVESLLAHAIPRLRARWLLRFDDDEIPSAALLQWIFAHAGSLEAPVAGFPRKWVWPQTEPGMFVASHCGAASEAAGGDARDDRQYRLFRPRDVTLSEELHTPGFDSAPSMDAPADAVIYHFDWLVRDRAARLAKLAGYDRQSPGSGARYAAYYLPEDRDPAFYAFAPVTDAAVIALAERLMEIRMVDKTSERG